jgi:MoaA/NifB/PqqE/SkfB family radical SAM enzyme
MEFEGSGINFFLHKDGEPLMDPLLFKRINYIKKIMKKSTVHFNTNASLLNDSNIKKILDSPLDSITFSVDGASITSFEHIRKGLDYKIVKRNIENFFEKKKSSGKKIDVIMQMVVDQSNIHEMSEYRKLWRDKADKIFFKTMHNFLVQKTSIHGSELSDKQLDRCKMPFVVMLFYWNGDAALCCWDYDHFVDLGNIKDDSLLKIYNSSKYQEIREAMRRKDCKKIKPCNICSQIYGRDGRLMCEEL